MGYRHYLCLLMTTSLAMLAMRVGCEQQWWPWWLPGLAVDKQSVLVFTGVVEDHQGTVVAYEEG